MTCCALSTVAADNDTLTDAHTDFGNHVDVGVAVHVDVLSVSAR